METNLILIVLVIFSLITIIILLFRGDKNRSLLNQQLVEFSEMSQRLAQEQVQNSIAAQAHFDQFDLKVIKTNIWTKNLQQEKLLDERNQGQSF